MFSKTTKFESLLEAVPEALVGTDQSGTIRFVNHQTEVLFGYDRDDLVGQHIETLVPESLWNVYLEHREGYFADPRSRSMGLDLELSGRHQDGHKFRVDISLSNVDTGDVLIVVKAIRAMDQQRKAFERAQRMTAIVEHSDDAIIGTTLKGTVTSWNAGAERMFGYSRREMIDKSIDALTPEDRGAESRAIMDRVGVGVGVGEIVDHFETVRVRKDGQSLAVSLSISPIRDEEGAVIGTAQIARDITERVTAFEAARAMIESSQDSLVSISPEGSITDANQATVKITGVPRDQLIGTRLADYFTDSTKAEEIYQRVFDQGAAMDYPLTIRHTDGTLTDVVYNGSIHRGSTGTVRGVFAAARDVTKLKEAFESSRAMIESTLDSLVAISPEGRITDVNEATIKVTGVPRERLIGTAFSDYFTDPEKANAIYQQVFSDGMALNYPLTIRNEDGSLIDVQYNASVYRDAHGQVLGVFAAARDVTSENKAKRELAQQRQIEMDRLTDLESFHRLTVGRELQMIELKKEIEFLKKNGRPAEGPHLDAEGYS